MIRKATNGDLTRLFELVKEMHAKSEFAERGISLSAMLTRSMLIDGVRRSGGTVAGSTFLVVAERSGNVEGFLFGILQPIYSIGVELEAQDLMLYCTKKAPKIAPGMMIDAYIAWASSNPKVHDIMLSWTNVMGVDGQKVSRLYHRKGFAKVGEIWKRGAK